MAMRLTATCRSAEVISRSLWALRGGTACIQKASAVGDLDAVQAGASGARKRSTQPGGFTGSFGDARVQPRANRAMLLSAKPLKCLAGCR